MWASPSNTDTFDRYDPTIGGVTCNNEERFQKNSSVKRSSSFGSLGPARLDFPEGFVKLLQAILHGLPRTPPMRTCLVFFALCLLPVLSVAAESNVALLSKLAPDADPRVLSLALEARDCAATALSQASAPRLAVIDYSRPSTATRLWVFDLERKVLLFSEVVAHGQGTGENLARDFSNRDGSHQSSLGLFRTADTYVGHNGYSLRMQGLEPGTNDAAMARAIVMHGAPYVNMQMAHAKGRLGRSWGCPALRPEVARQVIDSLKNGQMIFSYYPDNNWLTHSPFIGCREKALAANSAQPRGSLLVGAATLASAPR